MVTWCSFRLETALLIALVFENIQICVNTVCFKVLMVVNCLFLLSRPSNAIRWLRLSCAEEMFCLLVLIDECFAPYNRINGNFLHKNDLMYIVHTFFMTYARMLDLWRVLNKIVAGDKPIVNLFFMALRFARLFSYRFETVLNFDEMQKSLLAHKQATFIRIWISTAMPSCSKKWSEYNSSPCVDGHEGSFRFSTRPFFRLFLWHFFSKTSS